MTPLRATWGLLLVLLFPIPSAGPALAGAASNCSQTVGASAAAVPFPAAGSTGAAAPAVMLDLCNAHASQTLGVNWTGGTASIGAAGTQTLAAGACKTWGPGTVPAVPAAVSVIGSGAGTTTACAYQ